MPQAEELSVENVMDGGILRGRGRKRLSKLSEIEDLKLGDREQERLTDAD